MNAIILLASAAGIAKLGVSAAPAPAEQHAIVFHNYCGSGEPVFKHGATPDTQRPVAGDRVISGPLDAGRAWLQGGTFNCEEQNGDRCGLVEFALFNDRMCGVNYSLQAIGGHDHKFQYSMDYIWTAPGRTGANICLSGEQRAPGPCMGGTKETCPGVFLGAETEGGKPEICQGANVGLTIVFCPEKAPKGVPK